MGHSQPYKLEERIAYEFFLILGMAMLALVQITLLALPLGFTVDLVLVVVMCRVVVDASFTQPAIAATFRSAFYGGLMLDMYATTPLGSHALALVIVTIVIFAIIRRFPIENILMPLVAVFVGGLGYEFILGLIHAETLTMINWATYAIVIILPETLIALIPTLPVFVVIRWWAYRHHNAM